MCVCVCDCVCVCAGVCVCMCVAKPVAVELRYHATALIFFRIEGSNMIFHSLTFTRSRGKCWKLRAKPEVFNLPEGPCDC